MSQGYITQSLLKYVQLSMCLQFSGCSTQRLHGLDYTKFAASIFWTRRSKHEIGFHETIGSICAHAQNAIRYNIALPLPLRDAHMFVFLSKRPAQPSKPENFWLWEKGSEQINNLSAAWSRYGFGAFLGLYRGWNSSLLVKDVVFCDPQPQIVCFFILKQVTGVVRL